MTPIYTRSRLKSAVNARIHNKIGILPDADQTINDSVKEVVALMDLRSMKRRQKLVPSLFDMVYQYACPVDLKGRKIISIQPQNQDVDPYGPFSLVTEDDFNMGRFDSPDAIAIAEGDFIRKLLVSTQLKYNDYGFAISPLNSLSDFNTWVGFGDAINLIQDQDNYVTQNSSLRFDISAAGGLTAGIESSDLDAFDLETYLNGGSILVWAWITSLAGLNSYTLRVGNNSSNYYEMTVTASNEATPFVAGLNLLRFDLVGKTTVGSVDPQNLHYVALFMNKEASKISETAYAFNFLVARRGMVNNLVYYSKYAWQSSNGVYKEDSDNNSDLLNVDTEEYNLVLEKCVEHAADEAREAQDSTKAAGKFEQLKKAYQKTYKSEALRLDQNYYDL